MGRRSYIITLRMTTFPFSLMMAEYFSFSLSAPQKKSLFFPGSHPGKNSTSTLLLGEHLDGVSVLQVRAGQDAVIGPQPGSFEAEGKGKCERVGWWLRRKYFLPESDGIEVQALLVAVNEHRLPEGSLLLDLEAKKERA